MKRRHKKFMNSKPLKPLKKDGTDFIHNKEWIPEETVISVKRLPTKKELPIEE
jgi:hypothetical protein